MLYTRGNVSSQSLDRPLDRELNNGIDVSCSIERDIERYGYSARSLDRSIDKGIDLINNIIEVIIDCRWTTIEIIIYILDKVNEKNTNTITTIRNDTSTITSTNKKIANNDTIFHQLGIKAIKSSNEIHIEDLYLSPLIKYEEGYHVLSKLPSTLQCTAFEGVIKQGSQILIWNGNNIDNHIITIGESHTPLRHSLSLLSPYDELINVNNDLHDIKLIRRNIFNSINIKTQYDIDISQFPYSVNSSKFKKSNNYIPVQSIQVIDSFWISKSSNFLYLISYLICNPILFYLISNLICNLI